MKKKVMISDLRQYKAEGKTFTEIVCYDYMMASIVEESQTEMILVGDSLANVLLGLKSTVPVTIDTMIYHIRAVAEAAPNTLIIGDMPFGSYNVSIEDTIRNANRLMKEGGCDCVKLEGGREIAPIIKAIVDAGIPVMGHIGVLPQTANSSGGFKVRGATKESADELMADALALEKAGACMLNLECIPTVVAKKITETVSLSTIGAGAGPYCNGQELNLYDMTGFFNTYKPKYVKRYADMHAEMLSILNTFHEECATKVFPTPENSYNAQPEGY